MARIRQIAATFNEMVERLPALLLFNLLFFITALPIFTAGAAFAALDEMCLELLEEGRYPQLAARYWDAFKRHLKQAAVIWVVFLFAAFDLWLIFRYFGGIRVFLHPLLNLAVFMIILILAFIYTWVFRLIASGKTGYVSCIKAAFALSVVCWKKTLMCFFKTALMILLTCICPLLLIVIFSATSYLCCRTLRTSLNKYMDEGLIDNGRESV